MVPTPSIVGTVTARGEHCRLARKLLPRWQNPCPVMTALRPRSSALVGFSILAAQEVGDPASTRGVYAMLIALIVLGVLFIGLGVWLLRRTRPDHELLHPLEQMGTRSWRQRDTATQLRLLDDARPAGANPLRRADPAPTLVPGFAEVRTVSSFDDLAVPTGDSEDPPTVDSEDTDTDTDTHADTDAGDSGDTDNQERRGELTSSVDPADEAPADDPVPAIVSSDSSDVVSADELSSGSTAEVAESDDEHMSDDHVALEELASASDVVDSDAATSEDSDNTLPTTTRSMAGSEDDETVEVGRPATVAHEALLIARGDQDLLDTAALERPDSVAEDEAGPPAPLGSGTTGGEFTVTFPDRPRFGR